MRELVAPELATRKIDTRTRSWSTSAWAFAHHSHCYGCRCICFQKATLCGARVRLLFWPSLNLTRNRCAVWSKTSISTRPWRLFVPIQYIQGLQSNLALRMESDHCSLHSITSSVTLSQQKGRRNWQCFQKEPGSICHSIRQALLLLSGHLLGPVFAATRRPDFCLYTVSCNSISAHVMVQLIQVDYDFSHSWIILNLPRCWLLVLVNGRGPSPNHAQRNSFFGDHRSSDNSPMLFHFWYNTPQHNQPRLSIGWGNVLPAHVVTFGKGLRVTPFWWRAAYALYSSLRRLSVMYKTWSSR